MTVDPSKLRRASFRGVPFQVDSESPQGFGRRIIVHEYPKRDDPANEDMGAKSNRFTVKAYVVGDSFGDAMQALLAACSQPGAGTLILPVQGAVQVRCLDADASSARTERGRSTINLTFVREGSLVAPFVAILGARVALGFAQGAGATLGAAVSAVMSAIPLGWAGEAARQSALDALASIDVARGAASLSADAQADVSASLTDAARSLDISAGLAAIGGTIADTVRLFAGDSANDVTLEALEALATPAPVLVSGTPSSIAAANAANAIDAARSVAAYAEAAAGVAARDFSSRGEAILWRARYASLGAKVQEAAAGALDEASYILAGDIRGNLISQISQSIASLAPTIQPRSNLSLPATVWAWRLYRDPSRASELVDGNAVAHPSFMPLVFEASAS